jgi:O-antigen/teichoic acid export membrane protein
MPRYFLQSHKGTASLGVFVSIAYVLTATGTVINAIGQAASPLLADDFVMGRAQEFRSTVRHLILGSIGIGVAGIAGSALFGSFFLQIAFGPIYAEHSSVLVVLMLAAIFQYVSVFLGCAVNAVRRFSQQLYTSIALFIGVTVSALWLVPTEGLTGAAISLVVGQVIQCVYYVVIYRVVVLRAVAASTRKRT